MCAASSMNNGLIIGPASLFDMSVVLDHGTLDIEIVETKTIKSTVRPGEKVTIMRLQFTSQDWHGFIWRHPANIYIPSGYGGDGDVGIIGTSYLFWKGDMKSRLKIPGTGQGTEAEYAEGTAIDTGRPIMIFSLPGEDVGGMHEVELMGYGNRQIQETGDLTWYGYYALATCYLRAITLMQNLPEVRARKAVLMGCSKRGVAITIAAAVDHERIAGIVTTCHTVGNFLYFAAMKLAQLGHETAGPDDDVFELKIEEEKRHLLGGGFQPAPMILRSLNTPTGFRILSAFDPYIWHEQIKAPMLVTLGTNDEFFALGTVDEMYNAFQGEKAFLSIDNLPHTWVSVKHLYAWRMWLAHCFDGRPVPHISLTIEKIADAIHVNAKVTAEYNLRDVILYIAYNPSLDWRFVEWQGRGMHKDGNCYHAAIPLRDDESVAYYVEVSDIMNSIVSSLVEIEYSPKFYGAQRSK
jgi:hypothetical protein